MNIIKKFYYGDIPEEKSGGNIVSKETKSDWPLWEIFIRSKQGLDHKHVGAFMRQMHKWPLKMQEMFIPGEWKG